MTPLDRTCVAPIVLLTASLFAAGTVWPQEKGVKPNQAVRLASSSMLVELDGKTGNWSLLDKRSGVRWPTLGTASLGTGRGLEGDTRRIEASARSLRVVKAGDAAVVFELVDDGRSLLLRYEGKDLGEVRVLGDALAVTDRKHGSIIVPSREGLLIPADSGVSFQHAFGTSEYEGCHMNMLGILKSGAAMIVSWDDAYVWPEIESAFDPKTSRQQRITSTLGLRRTARPVRLTPLGRGDWNAVAAGYRRLAEQKGLAVTLREKIRRNPHEELLVGAANVKLWTCLARRMNEESNKVEQVRIHWTFEEAARIAEHLQKDIGISRCLFILGGWTEGGYDCRHPDALPANPECGGNEALATAIRRIQGLGYVACLHDNYQDMYRDAKSWNPDLIEKNPDGSLVRGGRWMGGRAFMVCAPKQVELAMRPQNLPGIQKLFDPWCYFIDTTYAVGPRECADPKHPLSRNDDIAWKIQLSDKSRAVFGLFGSECGREWALPHSDFFEGLVGVAGHDFHTLKPETLGARVIPFWEMVYHDCQICYGKYGYRAAEAGEFVAHHVLAARPLYYHSIGDHLYWTRPPKAEKPSGPSACFTRTDGGWAAGLDPTDAFLKTTHEVLGPLHAATAYQRLTRLELLTPDGTVRRATYGEGAESTTATVNFGKTDAVVKSRQGGSVLLPAWGFVVEGPQLTAFYAKRWNGKDYADGALFTLQPIEGDTLSSATRIRIFHGFGDAKINWHGTDYEVRREQVVATKVPQRRGRPVLVFRTNRVLNES
ncbi:MAG: DUF5696 domain-containing protein [Thermoguttaceae bacterium]